MADQRLLVLGAGPKAMALAAKVHSLRSLGESELPLQDRESIPEVFIIETAQVGANWAGNSGYTDGFQRLGTPPEKDIGFPYQSSDQYSMPRSLDEKMQGFSWHAYLIRHGQYSRWVDRGGPNPTNAEWALYLQWVGKKSSATVDFGTVHRIEIRNSRWRVCYQKDAVKKQANGDGLVITGPGDPKPIETEGTAKPHENGYFDGRTFWTGLDAFRSASGMRVAVIGEGGTAGSVIAWLVQFGHPTLVIDNFGKRPARFTREETLEINQLFSEPDQWITRKGTDPREFLERIDHGVYEARTQRIIDLPKNFNPQTAEIEKLRFRKRKDRGKWILVRKDGHELAGQEGQDRAGASGYDSVINAGGFDPLSFAELIAPGLRLRRHLLRARRYKADRVKLEDSLGSDLSLPFRPKLFLPWLAGPQHGPGLPYLACLGHLSDRIIIESYLHRPRNP